MPWLSSYSVRILLLAVLLVALAAEHVVDMGRLVEVPPPPANRLLEITASSVDEAVEQSIRHYDFDQYRNVIDDSIFAANLVIQKEPVEIVETEPVVVEKPPPPPPEPKPFRANLEVTGIVITPERKLVMVWDKSKKETHVLREQEKLYKWKVVNIDQKRVILRHELGGRYEFVVNEDTTVGYQD